MTGNHRSESSTKRETKRSNALDPVWCLLVGLAFVILSDQASAQPVDVPATWGGDLLSRPRLTGDWGGWRDELGKKGIVFDVDLLMTPQVVTSGGRSTGGSFWGNADYTLNVDTQKLGLWPGGFFKVDTSNESVVHDHRRSRGRDRRRAPPPATATPAGRSTRCPAS